MKTLTTILGLLITLVYTGFAQFEGVIQFQKVKSETTKYTYYIKGNNVRIDEFGTANAIKGTMLVDIEKGTVTALSPDRKLYMDATNSKVPVAVNPKVERTTNKKKIQGYDCTEWIVKSEVEGTTISYWVIDKADFPFFKGLLKTLNRKDRLSKYWLEVPGIDNLFTMVGEEKAADGTTRTKLEVIGVEPKKIDAALFAIPRGYVKFEK